MNEELKEILEEVGKIRNTLLDYKTKLRIDPFDLSANCAEQPLFYSEVASNYSALFVILQKLKLNLKEKSAVLALKIRHNPDDFGLKRVTDSSVQSIIDSNGDIINLEDTIISVNGVVIEAKGVLDAYEHRRSMLNNEVQLVLSGLEKPIRDNKTEKYKNNIKKIGVDARKIKRN